MLPIVGAEITYPDGSSYRIPEDGTWAEAPPFGVQCVVYYHPPDRDSLILTLDRGREIYTYQGEADGDEYKMGLWMDNEGFHRVIDLATKRVRP